MPAPESVVAAAIDGPQVSEPGKDRLAEVRDDDE
jgi:hypothetical protein